MIETKAKCPQNLDKCGRSVSHPHPESSKPQLLEACLPIWKLNANICMCLSAAWEKITAPTALNGNGKERKFKQVSVPSLFHSLSEATSFLIKDNLKDKELKGDQGE